LISARAINSRSFWPPERFMNQKPRLLERPSYSSRRSPAGNRCRSIAVPRRTLRLE
jgi:hypothetical protein